jgi:uncharacterized protein YdeI (YjbR/CyaY-like superfamily)
MAAEVQKHTWDKINSWEVELQLLQAIIAKTELVETTKWGGIVYTLKGKNILGIGGFKNYFTIWFFNGVFLKDENNVLVNAQEGVTKALRQWRLTSKEAIVESEILKYIEEAIANEKAGKSFKPEKKETIISAFFKNQLNTDAALAAAFIKLAPYKQREWIEYIETAKRIETKQLRMEKLKPKILAGLGLNDNYR